MVVCTKVKCSLINLQEPKSVVAMEYRSGSMVLFMKATGSKIKLKVKELSGTPRATFMLVNSRLIKPVDSESTPMSMAVAMKVSG